MMRAVAFALLLPAGEALRESTTVRGCSTPGCVGTATTTGTTPLQESTTVRLGSPTTATPDVAIGATTVQESTTVRPCSTQGCSTTPLQESTAVRPGSTTTDSADVAIGATTVQESTTVRPCSTQGCSTTPLQESTTVRPGSTTTDSLDMAIGATTAEESTTVRPCSTPGCGTTPPQESTTVRPGSTTTDSPDVAIGATTVEKSTTVRPCSTSGCGTTPLQADVATGIILSEWQHLPSGKNLQVSCTCTPEADAEEDEVVDVEKVLSLEELRNKDRVTIALPEGLPLWGPPNCACFGVSDDGDIACQGKLHADDVPLFDTPCTMDVELF